jgi:hypothetical protein
VSSGQVLHNGGQSGIELSETILDFLVQVVCFVRGEPAADVAEHEDRALLWKEDRGRISWWGRGDEQAQCGDSLRVGRFGGDGCHGGSEPVLRRLERFRVEQQWLHSQYQSESQLRSWHQ